MTDKKIEDPLRRLCGIAVTDTLAFQIRLLEEIRATLPPGERTRSAVVAAAAMAVVGIMNLVDAGKDEHDIARIIVAARSLRVPSPIDSLDLLATVCSEPVSKVS